MLPELKSHSGQTWGVVMYAELSTVGSFTALLWGPVGHSLFLLHCGFFFVLKFLLLKRPAPLSAPQRPIATHRTTATPKAGPGVVRKNPGVGNGDDEAAELMQQVGPSCVPDWSHLSGEDACCTAQRGLARVLVEDLHCLPKQSSSWPVCARQVLCGQRECGGGQGQAFWDQLVWQEPGSSLETHLHSRTQLMTLEWYRGSAGFGVSLEFWLWKKVKESFFLNNNKNDFTDSLPKSKLRVELIWKAYLLFVCS